MRNVLMQIEHLPPAVPVAPASPVLLHTFPSRIEKDKSGFVFFLSTNVMFGAKTNNQYVLKTLESVFTLHHTLLLSVVSQCQKLK